MNKSFSIARFSDIGESYTLTFERGEYVAAFAGLNLHHGEIEGISEKNRSFRIGGVWYDFRCAYKAKRPDAPVKKARRAKLSKVVAKTNEKHGSGLTDSDLVANYRGKGKCVIEDGVFTIKVA